MATSKMNNTVGIKQEDLKKKALLAFGWDQQNFEVKNLQLNTHQTEAAQTMEHLVGSVKMDPIPHKRTVHDRPASSGRGLLHDR